MGGKRLGVVRIAKAYLNMMIQIGRIGVKEETIIKGLSRANPKEGDWHLGIWRCAWSLANGCRRRCHSTACCELLRWINYCHLVTDRGNWCTSHRTKPPASVPSTSTPTSCSALPAKCQTSYLFWKGHDSLLTSMLTIIDMDDGFLGLRREYVGSAYCQAIRLSGALLVAGLESRGGLVFMEVYAEILRIGGLGLL